jgi:hypothetical protein
MKGNFVNLRNTIGWILPGLAMLAMFSCKKYNSLGYTAGSGAPTISSVHTYYKTDTTLRYDTVVTYNSAGQATTTANQLPPRPYGFDSVTTTGVLGNYYLIEGTNLGSATLVTFNGLTAYFNRAFSTDNSILVQLPSTTPYYGPAANDSLVITTTHGKVGYKFTILPPAPTVSSYSDFDFTAGNQITLKGVGFASVSAIHLTGPAGSSGNLSIISQSDSVLVVKFPSMSLSRGNLTFMYSSGSQTDSAVGTQELVDIDNAYQIFANGAIAPGWGSWSFDNVSISNVHAITASASYDMQFSAGGFKVDGWRNGGGTPTDGIPYSASYTYLVFYVYGGSQTETLYILWGDEGFGNGGGNAINAQTIMPNQWNYFKIPISTLLWNTSTTNWAANSSSHLVTLGFFMKSNSSVTEQLYFDDAVLVK